MFIYLYLYTRFALLHTHTFYVYILVCGYDFVHTPDYTTFFTRSLPRSRSRCGCNVPGWITCGYAHYAVTRGCRLRCTLPYAVGSGWLPRLHTALRCRVWIAFTLHCSCRITVGSTYHTRSRGSTHYCVRSSHCAAHRHYAHVRSAVLPVTVYLRFIRCSRSRSTVTVGWVPGWILPHRTQFTPLYHAFTRTHGWLLVGYLRLHVCCQFSSGSLILPSSPRLRTTTAFTRLHGYAVAGCHTFGCGLHGCCVYGWLHLHLHRYRTRFYGWLLPTFTRLRSVTLPHGYWLRLPHTVHTHTFTHGCRLRLPHTFTRLRTVVHLRVVTHICG